MGILHKTLITLGLIALASPASAAIMHLFSAVSVPVNSPWALGALGALIAVIVARAIRKR